MRVASLNVLAESYASPQSYPWLHRHEIEWDARADSLRRALRRLNADVLCLQVRVCTGTRVMLRSGVSSNCERAGALTHSSL